MQPESGQFFKVNNRERRNCLVNFALLRQDSRGTVHGAEFIRTADSLLAFVILAIEFEGSNVVAEIGFSVVGHHCAYGELNSRVWLVSHSELKVRLGPLGLMGVSGNMTWEFEDSENGTIVTLKYAVGGYLPGGLDSIAEAVDGVLIEQMTSLKTFAERGGS